MQDDLPFKMTVSGKYLPRQKKGAVYCTNIAHCFCQPARGALNYIILGSGNLANLLQIISNDYDLKHGLMKQG